MNGVVVEGLEAIRKQLRQLRHACDNEDQRIEVELLLVMTEDAVEKMR